MESKNSGNYNECPICLANARLPIVTRCGHIFCWECIKNWVESKQKMECPICKNGIKLNEVIKLYSGDNEKKEGEIDDRPQQERTAPQINKTYFLHRIANSFGLYGTRDDGNMQLPDAKEVSRNRLSLLMLIIGIILIVMVFK